MCLHLAEKNRVPRKIVCLHLAELMPYAGPMPTCVLWHVPCFLSYPYVLPAPSLTPTLSTPHLSMHVDPQVLRVLQPGGTVRIVVPDALAWLEAHVNHRVTPLTITREPRWMSTRLVADRVLAMSLQQPLPTP